MEIADKKNIIYSTLFIVVATIGLSVFADVAYIYTICGIAAWAAIGHLVTLDDDMPGEWSNMDGKPEIWKSSRFELVIKFIVLIIIVVLIVAFPNLANYGA